MGNARRAKAFRRSQPALMLLTRTHLMDILRILISLLLPPLGVFLKVGIGLQFWVNIVLTILGYVPGILHAAYVIFVRRG